MDGSKSISLNAGGVNLSVQGSKVDVDAWAAEFGRQMSRIQKASRCSDAELLKLRKTFMQLGISNKSDPIRTARKWADMVEAQDEKNGALKKLNLTEVRPKKKRTYTANLLKRCAT